MLASSYPTPAYAQGHCYIDPGIGDDAELAADYFLEHSELVGIFILEARGEDGAERIRLVRAYKGDEGQQITLGKREGHPGIFVGSFGISLGVNEGELAFGAIDHFLELYVIFECTAYILDHVPLGELLLALERRARAEPSAAAP